MSAPKDAAKVDVHRTLIYSDSKAYKAFFFIALAPLVVGIVGVSIHDQHDKFYWPAWGLLIAGAALALFSHFRMFNDKPLLTLSPKGLTLASIGKPVFIPWSEVRGIEAVDFKSWTAITPVPTRVSFDNVAAVTVSRDFYEDEIVSAFPLMVHHRVWSRTFRPQGDNLIQVCLHHDILPAKSEEIRRQVAARWYAFRDADKATTADKSTPPAPRRQKARDAVKFVVRWGKKPG